nr:MAG TPA: hypothetical protein [Caudoviricetes sp.]
MILNDHPALLSRVVIYTIVMKNILSTMEEPRSVTAIMVVVYCLISVTGVMFLLRVGSLPWVVIAAGAIMLISGILGAPSAWRGSWWLEGPAALLAVVGMLLISIDELLLPTAHVRWPLHGIILSVIIGLLFLGRALRVWPYSYRPGVLPKTELEKAEEKYLKTRGEYLAAINN